MRREASPLSVTVVIPAHNGGELVLACLERILPQCAPGDRVVVVDNGSWDGTSGAVARLFPSVHLITRRCALGFARACNLGTSQATTDALLFVNQDLLLASDGLARLKESHRARPNAVLGAVLLGPEGTTVQHAGGIILPNGITTHPHRGMARDALPREGFIASDYVTGALFFVSRAVFEALGGFDERFSPAYFEEADFCVRAVARGARNLVALGVSARHFEATVMGRDSARFHSLYHLNRLRFVMKHYPTPMLRSVFLPAERAWLRSVASPLVRGCVRRAYAALLLELPRWVRARRRQPPSFVPQEVAP